MKSDGTALFPAAWRRADHSGPFLQRRVADEPAFARYIPKPLILRMSFG